ncbi:MAG: class I SAM-dependent methyltransferase [Pseudomonadota bacterium]
MSEPVLTPGAVIHRVAAKAGCYTVDFEVTTDLLFDLDLQFQLHDAQSGIETGSFHIRQAGWDVAWLPRGAYRAVMTLPEDHLPTGAQRVRVLLWSDANGTPKLLAEEALAGFVPNSSGQDAVASGTKQKRRAGRPSWTLEGLDGVPVGDLSWNRGHEDWFFKHFDHAARVIVHLMLGQDERLGGRILDVGCGDGMTDLGVFLRCRPEEFVGVDPSKRYELLPEVAQRNHLPGDWSDDPRLRFEPADGNDLPFADNHFDVVLSWGSLEHIAGGYAQTLREIRRVLKPGGLLFVHPGLFFGEYGNHLGEFFDDPWLHLKLAPEALRERVLTTAPRTMDRGGEVATQAQYWQWYTELNPITVRDFEAELRALDFEPWRVALRTSGVVEYTPELLDYGFEQLANRELYVSAWNRKPEP